MAIPIPLQLNDLLEQNDRLNGSIHSVLALVVPWFEDNKLVFFPEYTDHGPKHISEVLTTAEALITDNAWGILNPEDAATLILGIILHDCAMHLSEDGFIHLITEERRYNTALKDRPWRQLWREFLAEATRFDHRKLNSLFGNEEPVAEPPLDSSQMTKRDRLLIGEFLRRHHPRLAHEIALTGIPGPKAQNLSLGEIPESIKELGGLTARSHGLDLRRCVDYLNAKTKWGARRTMGVHITYLMTLVRISDYLQIHRERAPQEILQIRSLKSPVSRGEWDAHAAIIDIHQETDDPEALWIETAPQSVKTYLKLKELFSDIQKELDDSWAVLGEVYGPKQELRNLGLTIRRIKSSLDDTEAFAKTVAYIPCRAAIEAVGADLLQLLIEPLYGARPEIGIRELLQNAVDACRELEDYLAHYPHVTRPHFEGQDADILVAIEVRADGSKWVTVSDHGIGMTVDTLLNYFLKAGASFRTSVAWRKQHEDEDGEVRVMRSGRFGIGVLTGFLLGDEIQVSTRHLTSQPADGIAFKCKLLDETIELRRVSRSIGTTIEVQVSDHIFSMLLRPSESPEWDGFKVGKHRDVRGEYWDWYCLKKPSVQRSIPRGNLEQKYELPEPFVPLPPKWRLINHPDFPEIHWTYLDLAPSLVCNGITIRSEREGSRWAADNFGQPKISVFDPYGRLPLNLQRTSLTTGQYPFEQLLLNEIHRDFIAYLLVNCPQKHPLMSGSSKEYHSFKYPGLQKTDWYWCGPNGVSLLTGWHLQQAGISWLHMVPAESLFRLRPILEGNPLCSIVPSTYNEHAFVMSFLSNWFPRSDFGWLADLGIRITATRRQVQELRETSEHNDRLKSYREESLNSDWLILGTRNCPPRVSSEERLYSASDGDLLSVATMFINEQDDYPSSWRASLKIIETWQAFFQDECIPYDEDERRDRFAPVYKELDPYIHAWESLKTD